MWSLPPGDTVLQMLTYVALTAQAMTAALAAGRRSMDWAGVCMLGCITALGGGTIRDVLLGHYPLVWVQTPSYLGLTAVAAFVTILIARHVHRLIVVDTDQGTPIGILSQSDLVRALATLDG